MLQTQTPEAVADQLKRGLRALENEAYSEAEQYVERGLETLRKASPALHYFQAGLQARTDKDWSKALICFRKAAQLREGDGARVPQWEHTTSTDCDAAPSGTRTNTRGFGELYFPRYFAGEALLKLGRDRCGEAREEWSAIDENALGRHKRLKDQLERWQEEDCGDEW